MQLKSQYEHDVMRVQRYLCIDLCGIGIDIGTGIGWVCRWFCTLTRETKGAVSTRRNEQDTIGNSIRGWRRWGGSRGSKQGLVVQPSAAPPMTGIS